MSEDDNFPLDDDAADEMADDLAENTTEVACPYCGEVAEIALDSGGGSHQEYVEDCQVCCRPWKVKVTYGRDGIASVTVEADDEEDPAE